MAKTLQQQIKQAQQRVSSINSQIAQVSAEPTSDTQQADLKNLQTQANNATQPNPGSQVEQPMEGGVNWKGVGVGAGTVAGNVLYMPAKLVYGILGGIAGGARDRSRRQVRRHPATRAAILPITRSRIRSRWRHV